MMGLKISFETDYSNRFSFFIFSKFLALKDNSLFSKAIFSRIKRDELLSISDLLKNPELLRLFSFLFLFLSVLNSKLPFL